MRLTFLWIILLSYLFGCYGKRRSRRNTKDGCESYSQVDGEDVKFPRKFHAEFPRPWLRKDLDAKLFESKALTYNWNWMKELKIRGLNATVEEFLNVLEKHGCLFIAYGEAVKDILLGTIQATSPLKLEGETTCEIDKVYRVCERTYGPHRCGNKPSKAHHRVIFGRMDDNERFNNPMVDPIAIAEWNLTFNRPKIQWEFTANAVGLYDNTAGGIYLIDMTGKSLEHICLRLINLPVDVGNRTKWTGNNLVKMLRYYNLEADGFESKGGMQKFIVREVKERYDTLKFQEYYCRFVYDGIFLISDFDRLLADSNNISLTTKIPIEIPECQIVLPDSRSGRIIGRINTTLEAQFGEFWHKQMLEDLQKINFIIIDDQVFLEGHSTQASYPRFNQYDYDSDTTTTAEPSEEYPGDDKFREELTNVDATDYPENHSPSCISIFITIAFFFLAFNILQ